jgi:WD40 repeat protein
VSRIFLSHSSHDNREAAALCEWLSEQSPELAREIFLDISKHTGLRPGQRWKEALQSANERCEAVICLLSQAWQDSPECRTEYRTAETLGKTILVGRLEDIGDSDITSEWQRCDLFAPGPQTQISVSGGSPVEFNSAALDQLKKAVEGSGIGPEHFVWPPKNDPKRAPYRGWEPFEDVDAGVFYGRDAAIVLGMDELRKMRLTTLKPLFVVLGPSGSGKSSFLRAGLIPRLQRDDRNFTVLGIVRPERNALTGSHGLAASIHSARQALQLPGVPPLGAIKKLCRDGDREGVYQLLMELHAAATKRLVATSGTNEPPTGDSGPTLVLPLDQAEELFAAEAISTEAAQEAERFLELLAAVIRRINTDEVRLLVAASIRTDRYEAMQNRSALDGIGTELFNELKTMPSHQFPAAIKGPAARASEAGQRLGVADDLVDRLIADAGDGADTLPLLALTLNRLYTDYGSAGEITLDDYESMGGMPDVVNNQIEQILAESPLDRDSALDILRWAFIPWLASINPDNDQPLRRVAFESELPAESRSLINAFVEKRLLVRDQRDGQVVLEVALESLLRQWDQLAEWLTEERQSLIAAADLDRDAIAWEKYGRNESWLLAGDRLVAAESVAARSGFAKRVANAADYLDASRQRENDRLDAERRRYRDAIAGRITVEAKAMLALAIPGGDERAFQQLLVARALVTKPDDGPILDALVARMRLLRIIVDTGKGLSGAAFSPNGLRLATTGDVGTVQVWDVCTGQPLGEPLTGHSGAVLRVVFSPDGQRLATASYDRTVRLWDVYTGQLLGEPLIGHTGAVLGVAFSPDGQRLATASADDTVRVWDTATGQPIGEPQIGHTERVNCVTFSPDGRSVASACDDGTVRIWDANTGQSIGEPLAGHTGEVSDVMFSPDGERLASCSANATDEGDGDGETVRVWDVRTGEAVGKPITGYRRGLTFSPDGRLLACVVEDETVRVCEVRTGQTIGDPLDGHTDYVNCVVFSPDGQTIATGSEDFTVRLWDADTGESLGKPLAGHTDAVINAAFSPDGQTLASVGWRNDGTVRLWDAVAAERLTGHTDSVISVAFSPDGQRLASASDDQTVRLWDVRTGRRLGEPLAGHDSFVLDVAFSPDGQRLASAGNDGTVRLWDAETGDPIGEPLTGHTESFVAAVVFSPDGQRLASGGTDDTVRLWDAETGDPIGEPLTGHTDSVCCVAFSPDGQRLATAGADGAVRVWDANTGHPLGEPLIGHADSVFSVAFSPDGQRLATAGADDVVRVWDANTGHPLGEPLIGHTDSVTCVAFSPDGARLASASRDGTVRVWDANTGRPLGEPLTGHTSFVSCVTFSPDGQRLASASGDDTVRIWPGRADPEMLCAKLASNMSRKHWREWVSPDIDYIPACPDLPIPSDDEPVGTLAGPVAQNQTLSS